MKNLILFISLFILAILAITSCEHDPVLVGDDDMIIDTMPNPTDTMPDTTTLMPCDSTKVIL